MYKDDRYVIPNNTSRRIFYRKYNDWIDFLRPARIVCDEASGSTYRGMGCASIKSEGERGEWSGASSLSEALHLAVTGWPEGREKVTTIRKRMSLDKLFDEAFKIRREMDYSGDEPDIPLYLMGVPEHMATITSKFDYSNGKVVSIVVNRTQHCGCSPEDIVGRGTGIYILLEALIRYGFSPELMIDFSCKSSGWGSSDSENSHAEYHVPILNAGDPVNLDTLAFMLINPAVERRIWFGVTEYEEPEYRNRFGFHSGCGYGQSEEPMVMPKNGILVTAHEGLCHDDASIEAFAISLLKRVGITPHEE